MTWSTVWEAFTAIGTVAMAVTTYLVIRQNRQQHHDALRPICVLVPEDGLDAFARRDILKPYEDPGKPGRFYLVKCGVRNVGGGPALHLRLIVRFPQYPGIELQAELPPLGSKQHEQSPIKVLYVMREGFNRMDYEVAPDGVWELWLIYEDLFGNVFHSRHTKDPQQQWVGYGSGVEAVHGARLSSGQVPNEVTL